MTNIDNILSERRKTHGDYTEHAACTQAILQILQSHRNWSKLADDQRETLHMIAHKMGRIVTGDPNVNDHWDDIAGYAKLSSERVSARLDPDTETRAMRTHALRSEYPGGHGYNPAMDV